MNERKKKKSIKVKIRDQKKCTKKNSLDNFLGGNFPVGGEGRGCNFLGANFPGAFYPGAFVLDLVLKIKFNGSCLKQDKITLSYGNIVSIYIVYGTNL